MYQNVLLESCSIVLTLGFAPLNDDLYRSRHVFFCILHDIIEGDVLKE